MKRALTKPFLVFHVILLGLAMLIAQQTPPQGDPQQPPPADQPPPAAAAISESGLLPVYGMTLELDKSWVDGKKFPNPTPVSAEFQQLYDSQIKPCGFNVLRVQFDVNDGKAEESTRLANLCVWAQQQGLKIAPILTCGEIGKPYPKDYAARAKAFVTTVVSALKRNKSANLPAYGQIAFYQLGNPLNHPGNHGVVDPATAAESVKKAAADIRAYETTALAEAGQPPTQLMASASFDFELLKGGAIVGVELSPDTFSQAFEALKGYLAGLADSPEIGMFSIEWFPGSVTSDATDKLADVVRGLMADVQGKLLLLSTGFSTGFRSNEDQSRFYALGFANLADLRASEGVDCPFTGVIWNGAINGGDANANPPSEQTAQNISGWDMASKAAELVKMLQEGGGDPDLNWWWKKTRSNFGVLTRNGAEFGPKQAHEVLTELQGATAQAAIESGVAETVQKIEDVQTQAAEAGVDPNAAPPVDPNTGQAIDPNAAPPTDPNAAPPIDPNTGLPIQPGAVPSSNPFQPVMDDLKTKLNGALGELLGGIIEKGKMGLSNLIGKLLGGNVGVPGVPGFDPNAGGGAPPIDPNTGQPIDPNTGLPIDPNTGLPIDPNTGQPIPQGGGQPGGGQPGGGQPTGGEPGRAPTGADLAFEGGVSPLGSLTTNVPITVTIAMKNNGDTQAEGATAYLIDQEGNAFAASEPKAVPAGATVNAEVIFTPPSAGSIPGVRVQLFCDNEAKPEDNFTDAGSITINDPAGGVDEGLPQGEPTPDEPGGGAPPSDPPPGGGGRDPGGVRPGGGVKPGLGGLRPGLLSNIKLVMPTFVGRKPPLGTVVRPPGIVPKLTLITPGLFNVASLTPGTTAKLMQATSADTGEPIFGPRSIGYQAGQPVPLSVPITNPFKRGFSNVRATLFVDGSQIASRNVGIIMPKQTRTVSFNEFTPQKAGIYRTEVRFEGTGPKGKNLRGKVQGEIRVLDATVGKALIRPSIIAPSGEKGSPRAVSGLMPTLIKPSILRPTILVAGGLTRPTLTLPGGAIPTRGTIVPGGAAPAPIKTGFTMPVIRTIALVRGAAVSLVADDVALNPFPPAAGASVSVTVRLNNTGGAPAKAVKVEAFADGKSLKSQTLDVPNGQQVVATQFDKVTATVGSHTIRVVATVDGKPQEISRTFDVKTGAIAVRPLISIPMRASLAFTGNDIQLNPIPQPNAPTSVTVNVRNPGSAAGSAEFEAIVDGRSLGKVSKTIGALQTLPVDGFPNWSPTAGSHTVKIVATIAGRQIAAEKAVNVTATAAIRPLLVRPSTTFVTPKLPAGLLPAGTGISRPNIVQPGGTTIPRTNPGTTLPGGTTNPGTTNPGGTTRPPINPGLISRPLLLTGPDVGVGVGDLSFTPAAPPANAEVTLNVKVHNFGGQEATGAVLEMSYQIDTQTPKSMKLPLPTIPAKGELVRNWKFKLDGGKQLVARVNVTHPQDRNLANAQGSLSVSIGAPGLIRPGLLNPGLIKPPATNPGTTLPGTTAPGTLNPGLVTRPGLTPGLIRGNPTPDLAVTAPDITFSPSSVKPNDRLNFNINVKNVGAADAMGSKLIVTVTKDGAAHETKEFPFDAKANETKTISYGLTVPAARQLVLTATVQHPADRNAGNGQATATVNVTQPLNTLPGRLELNPRLGGAPDPALGVGSVSASKSSAKIGDSVDFTVKVGNPSRAAANNVELVVRFLVNGKAAGERKMTLSVAAGRTEERKVNFKVPAGKTLQCIATVSVSGDANTGNNTGSALVSITG